MSIELSKVLKKNLLKPREIEGLVEFYKNLKTGPINPSDYARKHDLHHTTPSSYGRKLIEIGLAERKTESGVRIHYTLSKLGRQVAPQDFKNLAHLTPNWFEVLKYFVEDQHSEQECYQQTQIAESLEMVSRSLGRALDNLEQAGYISFCKRTRSNSPLLFSTTDKGQQVVENSPEMIKGEAEKRDLKIIEEKGSLTRTEIKDIVNSELSTNLKSLSSIRRRLDRLTERGLVEKRKKKDSKCYYLEPKGERTVEFWGWNCGHERSDQIRGTGILQITDFLRKLFPKLIEVIKTGREYENYYLNRAFRMGWRTTWEVTKEGAEFNQETRKLSRQEVRNIVESEQIIENYVSLEEYDGYEGLARTGELASLVEGCWLDPDFSFRVAKVVQENLPWKPNHIEQKLT